MPLAANEFQHFPLFVFGTLRRGESNHHYLAGRYERCLCAMLPDFQRAKTAHGFPQVTPAPGHIVTGELFFIRPAIFLETLRQCDVLEDLPPGKLVGQYYQRAQVVVETDEGNFTAWAYVDPQAVTGAQR
jgi:gamma-glutamylcyclotransferase (GGCT)/AIG2-like uncharacterized protein YtfP